MVLDFNPDYMYYVEVKHTMSRICMQAVTFTGERKDTFYMAQCMAIDDPYVFEGPVYMESG